MALISGNSISRVSGGITKLIEIKKYSYTNAAESDTLSIVKFFKSPSVEDYLCMMFALDTSKSLTSKSAGLCSGGRYRFSDILHLFTSQLVH